jgi:TolB-like protein/tetratricopeptide (TPR) repeat protein
MSDIFVSYKAEDRPRVSPIVEALKSEGFSVWWDAHIGGGEEWREAIETELHAAKCVIVVWSVLSVGATGRFVRDEATRAQRREAYLPIRIDAVDLPLGFGETHALTLVGWSGNRNDPRWQQTVEAIRAVAARLPRAPILPAPLSRNLIGRRALLAGGSAIAVLGGVGWWYTHRGGSGYKRLAVLPFANLSADPQQLYLCDGLAEELRTCLARLPGLEIVARISSEAVRGLDALAAAAKLEVGAILTGSIRHSGSQMRISAQLVNGKSGVALWSESYDRPDQDALTVQSEIAQRVATSLSSSLSNAKVSSMGQMGTQNTAAHDLFLRARQLRSTQDTEAGTREALSLAEAALALDPNYAGAQALKAGALSNLGVFFSEGAQKQIQLQAAMAAARRAIALDATLPEGYVVLAYLLKTQFDFRGALENYRLANSLADNARALIGSAFFLAEMGRASEAMTPALKATVVDPLNPDAFSAVGDVNYYAGRFEEAIVAMRRMLQLAPQRFYAHYFIGLSFLWLRRFDEAQSEFRKMPEGDFFRGAGEAVLAIQRGDRKASDLAMAPVVKAGPSVLLAGIQVQRGETESAIAMLDSAWEQRDPDLSALRADRVFDPVRKNPRFTALMAKLNFP